jgi:hypothetical protein
MAALHRRLFALLAVLALLTGAGWTAAALAYSPQTFVAQPAPDDGCGKLVPYKCDIPACGPIAWVSRRPGS